MKDGPCTPSSAPDRQATVRPVWPPRDRRHAGGRGGRGVRPPRAHAVRGQAHHRRAGPHGRATVRVPARARPLPDRRRARPRQDARRRDARGHGARSVRPHPVHARPRCRPTSSARGSTGRRASASTSSSGPIFANFVLADEINRAPAKVQSALLEVMAEQQVSIARRHAPGARPVPRARDAEPDRVRGRVPAARGAARPLPHEGRRRVPDADGGARDRQPDGRRTRPQPEPALDTDELLELQRLTDAVFVDPAVTWYAVSLVFATRSPVEQGFDDLAPLIAFGASPRATLGLVAGRPRARADPRPHLRAAAGRLRRRTRGAAPPDRAQLRGARRRHRRRPRRRPHRHRHPAAADLARPGAGAGHPGPGGARADRGDPGATRPRANRPRGRDGRRPPGPARRSAGPRRPCAASSSTSSAGSTGCCRATTSGWCPRPAPSRARAVSTAPATTSAASTGPSPPAPPCRTCATRSPTASSRRGSSSTARPASTSGPPSARSATSRSPTVAAVGFLTSRVGQPGRRGAPHRRRHAGRPRARRPQRDVRAAQPHRRGAARRQPPRLRPTTSPTRCSAPRASRAGAGLVVVVSDFLAARRLGRDRSACSRRATTCSRSRSSTRASSSCRRSGSSPSSTPRPVAGSRCRPRASGSARASPRPRPSSAPTSPARIVGARAPSTSCCAPTATGCSTSCATSRRRRRRARRAVPLAPIGDERDRWRERASHELPRRQPPVAAARSWSRCSSGYIVVQRQRRPYAVRFTNVDLLASVAPKRPGWRRHLAAGASLLALTLLVLGVRQAGTHRRGATRDGHRDAGARRLELDEGHRRRAHPPAGGASRGRRRSSTRCRKRFRLGLVLFAGSVQVAVPPTHERVPGAHRGREHRAAARDRHRRGDLRVAVRDPVDARRGAVTPPARIVLLSDGDTNAGPARTPSAVEAANRAGVPVSTIAFGTDEGTILLDGEQNAVPVNRDALRGDRCRHQGHLRGGGHREGPAPHLREHREPARQAVAVPPGHDVVRGGGDGVRVRGGRGGRSSGRRDCPEPAAAARNSVASVTPRRRSWRRGQVSSAPCRIQLMWWSRAVFSCSITRRGRPRRARRDRRDRPHVGRAVPQPAALARQGAPGRHRHRHGRRAAARLGVRGGPGGGVALRPGPRDRAHRALAGRTPSARAFDMAPSGQLLTLRG